MQKMKYIKRVLIFIFALITAFTLAAITILITILENPSYDEIKREIITGNLVSKDSISRPFWNLNVFVDSALVEPIKFLNPNKTYFRNGIKSLSFIEHLNGVHLNVPDKIEEGMYELEAETLEGKMYPAFRVYHWYSNSAPTIIYNHGASQVPFDAIFASIFDRETIDRPLKVNLIVIRTPFHQKGRLELPEASSTLSRFMSIMAVSVKLTEKLVQHVRQNGSNVVEVAGLSMGGYIINRHHLIYNSATYYIPFVSGTAFDKVFLIASKADPSALKHPDIVSHHLNFTNEWKRFDNSNVFPILARYDNISRLEHQGPSYGNTQIEVWENKGHITAALSVRALRYVLLRHILSGDELKSYK